jgi:hypothetical protein
MRYQVLALLAAVGSAVAQGVTEKISPKVAAPDGCKTAVDGKFEIAIVPLGAKTKRDSIQKRAPACSGQGILVSTLSDGTIKDALDRTGYIASNYQFQFDGPPQAGAIYTAGFSHCGNGSLALGDSAVFYQCKSGNFYNLYDRWWAAQCEPVQIMVLPCGEGAEVVGGLKTVGTSIVATTVVMPLSDGQPQVITTTQAIPLCQIGDGQVQGHTTPCAAITAVPTPVSSVAPVSQFSDGQIQVTPVAPGPGPAPPAVTGSVAVSVPAPSATGINGTTFRTTAPLPPPSVVPTNAPPASSAGRFQAGSATALIVGLIGALWVL